MNNIIFLIKKEKKIRIDVSINEYFEDIYDFTFNDSKFMFLVNDNEMVNWGKGIKERKKTIIWIIRICKKLEYENSTLFTSISLFDRSINKIIKGTSKNVDHLIEGNNFKNMMIACLGIAHKFNEIEPFSIEKLINISKLNIEKDSYILIERTILSLVEYNVDLTNIWEKIVIFSRKLKNVDDDLLKNATLLLLFNLENELLNNHSFTSLSLIVIASVTDYDHSELIRILVKNREEKFPEFDIYKFTEIVNEFKKLNMKIN